MRAALERQRVVYCSSRYRDGRTVSIRVLVGRNYFDVREDQYKRLTDGATPKALGLMPLADEQAGDA